jgi:hypothetical protein
MPSNGIGIESSDWGWLGMEKEVSLEPEGLKFQ